MKTVTRKRIEIVVEAAWHGRLIRLLDDLQVTGYTTLPVMGGRGEGGEWSREGQVSTAFEMVMVICILHPDRAGAAIEALGSLVQAGRGVFNITDVEVLRGEKF